MKILTDGRYNEKDFNKTIRIIYKVLNESKISYKLVDDTLVLYPDNYGNTEETSRYIPFISYYELIEDYVINFMLDEKEITLDNLKSIIQEIKNNTYVSEYWEDSPMYAISQESIKAKEYIDSSKSNKELLNSLKCVISFINEYPNDDYKDTLYNLKNLVKFLEGHI